MLKRIFKLRRDERGSSMLEYALLASLIAVVCISSLGIMGNQLGGDDGAFKQTGYAIRTAGEGVGGGG